MIPPDFIVSASALVDTEERLFPASRHRSKRILKKLIKRFGSEFRRKPAIFKMGDGRLIVHPAIMQELQRKFAAKQRDSFDQAFMRTLFPSC